MPVPSAYRFRSRPSAPRRPRGSSRRRAFLKNREGRLIFPENRFPGSGSARYRDGRLHNPSSHRSYKQTIGEVMTPTPYARDRPLLTAYVGSVGSDANLGRGVFSRGFPRG
ncbi:hypothetical protein FaHV1S18_116 [Falconid herpesvirus 1]|uniref:Uncharacterized protein n=2 Tax=Columbid alphaherpesvirus 1 TaxID=93386 RepID=A0A068ES76_9ALPH|nr:hypothetical protein FaHV1S18_100 [Falconid herpesvirus 1]YP_009046600.1 hypothetical protein FaHV1S18_116 [Falconid herpesvirus 1]YP_009352994.1 hypothetical protein CoHVHLJ_100 [Columbid alphaherpesvirus 1]YP_009353010.1 hypothetical protein CoHVHLJ_116 [Columbid alphaherpesvirus 1]AID52790.1 hypothetical protein FaHV1S18_100 [Falconid herpesvirus 1]AID52806.1 hypothetical protein FaHV1S18_116 [Falconid herpesvirus 1]ARD71411.1 hypothetical protein CoHVHLJ_100 [Columbid alphaherpesvirus 